MQKPLNRGEPLNNARYKRWLANFSTYASHVTRQKIELWLDQFDAPDQDVANRILDAVLFIGHDQIRNTFRQLLDGIPGWHSDPTKRKGQWVFVPFSGSVGESGDSMVHAFRMATGMTQKRFNPLFVHRSELVRLRLKPEDTVVLIDDFSGTGNQATTAWKEVFSEILSEEPRTFLLLVAATKEAVVAVRENTEMELSCGKILDKRHNFFAEQCNVFSNKEKSTVEHYCRIADNRYPRGSGSSGLLVVLAHRCPNNSLPILHADHKSWSGLFPRHFD
jgi:hypothetical protein